MKYRAVRAGCAVLAVLGVALVVRAQGSPPPDGFGHRGPGPGPGGPMAGSFEFGGLVGGFGGKSVTGKPFQAKFTITRVETLPNNTITNTVTADETQTVSALSGTRPPSSDQRKPSMIPTSGLSV